MASTGADGVIEDFQAAEHAHKQLKKDVALADGTDAAQAVSGEGKPAGGQAE